MLFSQAEAARGDNRDLCANIRWKEWSVTMWEWSYALVAVLTNLTALPTMRQALRSQRHQSRRAHDAWMLLATLGVLVMNAVGMLLFVYLPPGWIQKMVPTEIVNGDCNINVGTDAFPIYFTSLFVVTIALGALSTPLTLFGRAALAALPDTGAALRLRDCCLGWWATDEDGAEVCVCVARAARAARRDASVYLRWPRKRPVVIFLL